MNEAVRLLFTGEAEGAVAAAKETDAAIAGVGRTSRGTNSEVGKLERGVLAGSGAFRGLGRSIAFASGAFLLAGGFSDAIKGSIDQAEKLEKATESLRVGIRHNGEDVDAVLPKYQAVAKAAAEYGVSEADATQELARATLLTGNHEKALRAYQDALVISKATGKDFNAVLTGTSKAQEGSTTSLARYGIMLPKVTTAQDALKASNDHATKAQLAHAQALDIESSATEASRVIMQRFGGQAAANTTQMDRFRANAANLGAELGGPLLSILNLLAGSLSTVLGWIQKNSDILKPLALVIGVAAAAWGGYLLVTEGIPAAAVAATAGIEGMSAALMANPIGLIITLIATLVVAIVELWKHSETFRRIVLGVWDDVKAGTREFVGFFTTTVPHAFETVKSKITGALAAVLDWVKGHWYYIAALLTGPFAPVALAAATAFGMRDRLIGAFDYLKDKAVSIWHAIVAVFKSAGSSIESGLSPAISTFSRIVGWLRQIVSWARDAIGWLSKVHLPGSGVLHSVTGAIGGLFHAAGGIATSAQIGVIGEAGPEAIVPLTSPHANAFADLLAGQIAARIGGGGGGGGPSYFSGANITVLGTTKRQVAQGLEVLVRNAPRTPAVTVVAR